MIGDELLKASVYWRGTPDAYQPGGLDTIGESFGRAFATASGGIGFDPDLAFEYFTGLLFNANYSTLAELSSIVESWLEFLRGDVYFHFGPWYWKEWVHDDAPLAEMACPETWLALAAYPPHQSGGTMYHTAHVEWTMPTTAPVPEHMRQYLIKSVGFQEQWGVTTLRYSDEMRSIIPFVAIVGHFWEGRDKHFQSVGLIGQPITEPPIDKKPTVLYPRSEEWPEPEGKEVNVWFPEEVQGLPLPWKFKPEIMDAVVAYVGGERAYKRLYPGIDKTAVAENGYVFSNWALEKFGSPVAQEI